MEVDQFISAKKAGVKACKMLKKKSVEPNNEGSEENETSDDNIWPEKFTRYFRYFGFWVAFSTFEQYLIHLHV